ncbi:MAG: GNAT family N-acetyltransferase [Chloroflexi bacterium]|nr:GNAT family N-acetyltransferase [Chloroflexota bacterium]
MTPDELHTQVCAKPELIAATVAFRDGTPVVLRPLAAGDVQMLGDYFLSLTAETRRRYGPHPFDRKTAEQICSSVDLTDTLRMLAIIHGDGGERVIAYFILILGIRDDDALRYAQLGIPLDARTDCTLAPSVADEYQSKGLGSLVMRHLLDVARKLGRKRMVLWGGTQATNDRAIHFYHKHGFHTVGQFEEPPGFNNYDMILSL